MGQRQEKKKESVEESLEIRGVGKEILGDAPLAMLFGIGISGAIAEIGKAVFPSDIRGKLRYACHDRDKEITGV
jgi:hypothetical protein